MFLPKKEETLAEFFPSFPKFSSNLEHFERFRTPFDSQHTKGSQTMLKSAQQHFQHILSSL